MRSVPFSEYEHALGELGNTYNLQGDTQNGEKYLQQALDVAIKANIAPDAALWAGNLAAQYLDIGDWDRAEALNTRAREIRSASHSGNIAYNTLNAARIAQGRQQLETAAQMYRDALAHAEDEAGIEWDAHRGLAEVALAAGQPETATTEFDAALDVIDRHSFQPRQNRFESLVPGAADQVLWVVCRRACGPRAGRTRARSRQLQPCTRALRTSGRRGTQPAPGGGVQARRCARTARRFCSTGSASDRHASIVTADGIRCVQLPPASTIDTLVHAQQQAIAGVLSDPLAKSNTAGRELYRLLVAPFASALPPGSSVLVVPDGSLTGLNFETLPVDDAQGSHYWIEDVRVAVAPALGMPLDPGGERRTDSLLLIGDATAHAPEFPALRYAAPEMTAITRHFDASPL